VVQCFFWYLQEAFERTAESVPGHHFSITTGSPNYEEWINFDTLFKNAIQKLTSYCGDSNEGVSMIQKVALSLLLSLCLISCANIKAGRPLFAPVPPPAPPVVVETPAEKAKSALYEWNGDKVPGAPSVRISLAEQKARIYKEGQEVGWTYVATGTAAHRTPTGTFHISDKQAVKRSNLWGKVVNKNGAVVSSNARNGRAKIPAGGRFVGASMPNWMRLTSGGIGMHGGPIPNPGSPASHGCIRLPYAMAQHLFADLPTGTRVTIF
jgi:hypothetical protein